MRVAVIGSGAMGSIFGAALSRSGEEVIFFDSRGDLTASIKRDGLVVSGVLGTFHLRSLATSRPQEIGRADCALIMVDANATRDVTKVVKSCLGEDGFALTLQNGIGNIESLSDALGSSQVLGGSTYNSGASLGLGRVVHSNSGPTWIGEVGRAHSERAKAIAARFTDSGLPTTVSDNIMGVVWSKFVHNCAINAISAITGLRPGEIARNPWASHILTRLLDEILAVVDEAGITLPEHDPRTEIYDHTWERYNRPSMQQHLDSGRSTEIDALNGALVKKAEALGISAPVNETITAVIKSIEASRRIRKEMPDLDEAALERAARADARNGRWGTV
jgi:2-dehydropantoate 2-reductase